MIDWSRRAACIILLAGFLLGGLPCPCGAEPPSVPLDGGLPVRVKPAVRVDQITEISEKDSLFKAALTLTYTWHDRRLAFDGRAAGRDRYEFINESARSKAATIWVPKVSIINSIDIPKSLGMILVIRDNGTVQLTEKLIASLEATYILTDFPFDRQRLSVRLASSEFNRETVLLREPEVIPNTALTIKGWRFLRTTGDTGESLSITGRPMSNFILTVDVKRNGAVAVTQIFLPYLAIIFMPLICLYNVGASSPTQLFTALLALLTLNFKVVLEQPMIVTIGNSVVDAMWMGYCYIGISLILVFTVMRPRPADAPPLGDMARELQHVLKWMLPTLFLAAITGRVCLALN